MTDNQYAFKNSIVTEMFVDTADQNYLIARWAYHRGMYIDFFWNSAHALEKYMKAALLLNGKSSKGYGHDLNKLFAQMQILASELFPETLTMPQQFRELRGKTNWRNETPAKFIKRFSELGRPDNRYNTFGYTQRWEDLHHLDEMVFLVRRLAVALDEAILPKKSQLTARGHLNRSVRNAHGRGVSSRLYKLLSTSGDDELRDAGLKLNFQFAPKDYDHSGQTVTVGWSSSNSVLYRRIVERATKMDAGSADKETAELADWAIENINFSGRRKGGVKEELQNAAKILRQRSS
jgi:HEPN domain-containing protein